LNALRKLILSLARVPDTPQRTALSYAIGVFWSFSPFLGLHTVLAIGTALVFRLNRLATLMGVWTNLPWIVIPYYALATWVGMKILGTNGITFPAVGLSDLYSAEFWEWLASQWKLLIPAVVGSSVLALALSIAAYPAALFIIRRYRDLYCPEPLIEATLQEPESGS